MNRGRIDTVKKSNLSENELLNRARNGDLSAFDQIVEMYAETVWYSARALCGNDHDADDLVQETFVEAWKALPRFKEECRFFPWLIGILKHRFLKSVRKPRPSVGGEVAAAHLSSREIEPLFVTERAEDARILQVALNALPEEHRLVLELRFFAGLALDEIATLLDCPLGTVKSRLHNGLEKLRRAKEMVNHFADSGESSVSET